MGRAGPGEEFSGLGSVIAKGKRRSEVAQARAGTGGWKEGRGRCPRHPLEPET